MVTPCMPFSIRLSFRLPFRPCSESQVASCGETKTRAHTMRTQEAPGTEHTARRPGSSGAVGDVGDVTTRPVVRLSVYGAPPPRWVLSENFIGTRNTDKNKLQCMFQLANKSNHFLFRVPVSSHLVWLHFTVNCYYVCFRDDRERPNTDAEQSFSPLC